MKRSLLFVPSEQNMGKTTWWPDPRSVGTPRAHIDLHLTFRWSVNTIHYVFTDIMFLGTIRQFDNLLNRIPEFSLEMEHSIFLFVPSEQQVGKKWTWCRSAFHRNAMCLYFITICTWRSDGVLIPIHYVFTDIMFLGTIRQFAQKIPEFSREMEHSIILFVPSEQQVGKKWTGCRSAFRRNAMCLCCITIST